MSHFTNFEQVIIISHFDDFEQVKKHSSHLADFEQVIIISHFSNFEQVIIKIVILLGMHRRDLFCITVKIPYALIYTKRKAQNL